jgi:hypothetical protein
MSACNCCEEFPVDAPGFEYRSRSNILNKCGFLDSETYYFKETTTYTSPLEGGEGFSKINAETQETEQWNGETLEHVKSYEFNADTCVCEFSETGYFPEDFGNFDPPTFFYEDEYTDSLLETNNYGCLEKNEFSEWDNVNEALAERIIIGGQTASESEMEVRLLHQPTATAYLKVWLWQRERDFDPETAEFSAPTDSLFETYEWSGTPPAPEYGINEPENQITEIIAVPRLGPNSSVKIFVAKWSLIEGYEPDDPLVDEETFELSRPSPDCESNGVPTLTEECPFRE